MRPEFTLRFTDEDTIALGLANRVIISPERFDYFTFSSFRASYLFYSSSLFEALSVNINIFRSTDETLRTATVLKAAG